MSQDMLGTIVRMLIPMSVETHGVVIDLLSKLTDPKWLVATKRFLRKENPWPAEIKLWERISDTAIRVNLDFAPKLPFDNAKIEWNHGSGWVTVERRDDDLFVDGTRVVHHLVEGQKIENGVQGHEVHEQLKTRVILHPNIMDALFENPHLIPDNWKVDEQGCTRFIYFWAVGYRGSRGCLYVRYLCWGDGVWGCNHDWLVHHWGVQHPAAVLAS